MFGGTGGYPDVQDSQHSPAEADLLRHCADRWRVVLDTSCLRHLWRVNEGAGRSAAWCVGRVHACGGLGEKISPQNSLCSLRDAFESMRTADTIWNPFFPHRVKLLVSAGCGWCVGPELRQPRRGRGHR